MKTFENYNFDAVKFPAELNPDDVKRRNFVDKKNT